MSTATQLAPTRPAAAPDPAVAAVPFRRLVQVELRKMFDTRSGFWLMASILISSVLATAAVIAFAPDDALTYSSFAKAIGYPMMIILPVVAILSVTSEWSQRTGLTTFTLLPHRGRVVLAKGTSSVAVGVASMLLAFAVGAAGNVLGTAVTGTAPVWDVSLADSLHIVLGNVLGLLTGFMLGVLIRNSPGAIVANSVYSFVLPTALGYLAVSQDSFLAVRPWVDVTFAQAALLDFNGYVTGEQWANIAVTGVCWLLVPLAVGLALVLRSEVKSA